MRITDKAKAYPAFPVPNLHAQVGRFLEEVGGGSVQVVGKFPAGSGGRFRARFRSSGQVLVGFETVLQGCSEAGSGVGSGAGRVVDGASCGEVLGSGSRRILIVSKLHMFARKLHNAC